MDCGCASSSGRVALAGLIAFLWCPWERNASLPLLPRHACCRPCLPVLLQTHIGPAMNVAGKHQSAGQLHPQVTTSNVIKDGPLQLSTSHHHRHSDPQLFWARHHPTVTTACMSGRQLAWARFVWWDGDNARGDTRKHKRGPRKKQNAALQVERSSSPEIARPVSPQSPALIPNFRLYHPHLSRCKTTPRSRALPRPNGRGTFLGGLPRLATLGCHKHGACVQKHSKRRLKDISKLQRALYPAPCGVSAVLGGW